ncbi:MAG: class I SAM-dependent methyltransferase [Acidobacteriaceae bacterium]
MSEGTEQSVKADYGIDAPGVIRNLAVIGAVLLIAAGVARHFGSPWQYSFFWTGIALEAESVLMLAYSRWGKLLHRDRMLGLHRWRGDEEVLDVGTGRGLLLVGAARRLTTGHATGIDIWNAADLSANTREHTEANLAREGVARMCALMNEDAVKMSFGDGSFDVVVSNLCLHNIGDREKRRSAVREIARVLKPGGEAILSDFKKTGEYARELRREGLEVTRRWPNLLTTFPPLRIVGARKAVGR